MFLVLDDVYECHEDVDHDDESLVVVDDVNICGRSCGLDGGAPEVLV